MRLLAAVGGVGIWLWLGDGIGIGAVAASCALVLRFSGMSQWVMWEMSALFENIGTVRDGIASISLPRLVADPVGAKPLAAPTGDIQFNNVSFHYGKTAASSRGSTCTFSRARRSASSGAPVPASRHCQPAAALLRRRRGRITIDGADIATRDAGQRCAAPSAW